MGRCASVCVLSSVGGVCGGSIGIVRRGCRRRVCCVRRRGVCCRSAGDPAVGTDTGGGALCFAYCLHFLQVYGAEWVGTRQTVEIAGVDR